MKLKSIEISGVRSIANATLELGDFSVLIGENGSGNSALVETLEILRRWAGNRSFNPEGEARCRLHEARHSEPACRRTA